MRCEFERASAGPVGRVKSHFSRTEPFVEAGVHGGEPGPRRRVSRIQMDGANKHLPAGRKSAVHHTREMQTPLQVVVVCLRNLAARRRGAHDARSTAGGRAPGSSERLAIETFRCEQPDRRREMLFALTEAAATRHRPQQALVRSSVERRELQPLLQMAARLSVRNTVYELLEQREAPGPETPTLGKKPTRELRAALDLQSFEKVAVKEREEFARPFSRKRAHARLRGASYFERVHANCRTDRAGCNLPGRPLACRRRCCAACSVTNAARHAGRWPYPTEAHRAESAVRRPASAPDMRAGPASCATAATHGATVLQDSQRSEHPQLKSHSALDRSAASPATSSWSESGLIDLKKEATSSWARSGWSKVLFSNSRRRPRRLIKEMLIARDRHGRVLRTRFHFDQLDTRSRVGLRRLLPRCRSHVRRLQSAGRSVASAGLYRCNSYAHMLTVAARFSDSIAPQPAMESRCFECGQPSRGARRALRCRTRSSRMLLNSRTAASRLACPGRRCVRNAGAVNAVSNPIRWVHEKCARAGAHDFSVVGIDAAGAEQAAEFPNQASVRRIVPRLPGSWISCR